MKNMRWIYSGIMLTFLLASCGGDDNNNSDDSNSFFRFVENLSASVQDKSEPIDVEGQVPSQSDTEEPVEVK